MQSVRLPAVASAVGLALLPAFGHAQTQQGQGGAAAPGTTNQQTPGSTSPQEATPTGLWERSNLLGTIGGLRTVLGEHGISFGLTETDEVLGNPDGGRAQQAIYEGLTEMSAGVDMQKAAGLAGGIFNVSAFQIHGRGLSLNAVPTLVPVSSIEADRATRLYELWYQQAFLNGTLDVRAGQLGADQEFMVSQYAGLFINASFGWPTNSAVDMPAGGPAYPLASTGLRVRVRPRDDVTVLTAVLNGSPAGFGPSDPQVRNASGTRFGLNSGALVIGEVQYAVNQGDNAKGLPGTYKLGFWYDTKAPGGQNDGTSFYGIVDQLVFRPPGAKDGGLGIFLRALGDPNPHNPVSVFIDGGVSYKGVLGRDGDTIGLGFGWSNVSTAGFESVPGSAVPLRGHETLLELTYQAQVAPWWVVQPDAQYIINAGGGVLNPDGSGKIVGNAVVLGMRSVVTF
jgi:porin